MINISKEKYITTVNSIKKYRDIEDKIDKASKSTIRLWEINEINIMIESIIEILKECTNDYIDSKDVTSNIEYFIYELDFGRNYEPGMVKDSGKNISMRNAEDLWRYLLRLDKEGNKDA